MRRIITILITATTLLSCTGTNKVADVQQKGNTQRRKAACGKVHVDMNKPHIDWYEADKSALYKSTEAIVLPKDYKVYTTDTAQLTGFLNALNNGSKMEMVVPLPAPADCQVFTIHKYKDPKAPGIIAEGESKSQKIYLSLNKGMINGWVKWFEIEYRIIAQRIEGIPYYIVYTKVDMPENKTQKESSTNNYELKKVRYDK